MFSWDPQKAILNFGKHGTSFEEAATIFADPDGLDLDDPGHSQSEPRLKRIGVSITGRILLTVYTLRRGHGGEETTIRIIGARQASRKERRAYARSRP